MLRALFAFPCAICVAAGVLAAGEPAAVSRQSDKSCLVKGKTYTARVDASGNLRSLLLDGVEVLNTTPPKNGGAFPALKGPASVVLQNNTIVASAKDIRVEYAFDLTGFNVATTGGTVEFHLEGVTAAVAERGNTTDGKEGIADVHKVVFGKLALGLDKPFHLVFGRLVPSHLCGRGGKPEDKFAYRVECGVAVDPVELVTAPVVTAEGKDAYKVPGYKKGETPVFEYVSGNLGASAVAGEIKFTLKDHWVNGKVLMEKTLPVTIPAGQKTSVKFAADEVKEAGFYWLYAEFAKDSKVHKQAHVGFIHDGANYKPPLTRPADFKDFWEKKLQAMRAIPFDAKLTEVAAQSTDKSTHYELEVSVAAGKRIKTFLRAPKAPGKHDAEVVSHWGSDSAERIHKTLADWEKQKVGAGMWERGTPRIRVGAPQPDDSTYTRWNGLDDNNMLDSYLLTVRMTDYLRSRDDVAGIYLFGASRSGPLQIANAALDPRQIVAVNAHVPTSAGLSWKEKEYRGWGSRPANMPLEQALGIAAYFDPVNFAPDLTVPLLVDGGISDDLAPAPGILALANWAEKAPWKRCSIEKGGHGYFSNPARNRFEAELAEYLKAAPAAGDK